RHRLLAAGRPGLLMHRSGTRRELPRRRLRGGRDVELRVCEARRREGPAVLLPQGRGVHPEMTLSPEQQRDLETVRQGLVRDGHDRFAALSRIEAALVEREAQAGQLDYMDGTWIRAEAAEERVRELEEALRRIETCEPSGTWREIVEQLQRIAAEALDAALTPPEEGEA